MESKNKQKTTQPAPEPVRELISLDSNKPKSFKKMGTILAAISLAVVIIAVGYFLVVRLGKTKPPRSVTPSPVPTPTIVSKLPITEADTATAALEEQSDSDEIADIEKDLNSTSLKDIDKELTDIESELSSP